MSYRIVHCNRSLCRLGNIITILAGWTKLFTIPMNYIKKTVTEKPYTSENNINQFRTRREKTLKGISFR